ncbi:phosphoglycerate mutase-like protein [Cristinia sonorae]|uniref:Phosphoglycerate mutase-like protein n=1 Tax=Cristinia sonorae TaxID=1940300 RepID=A0A8K0UHK5_9AGAR|nr:phosphoglycerate mutase-like protein [Cristinia sonorae]
MSHPEVHGVVVIARNGDRTQSWQDPVSYKAKGTTSTPLGEVQSHQLGSFLRKTYLDRSSSSHIRGISTDLVDLKEVHVRVKVGSEGASVFDSATAVLQGLFPPNEKNRMTLANETTVVAPLGGYQYIPVETVEPVNDRSLEPWTDCPAFQERVKKIQNSDEFKKKEQDAQKFFRTLKDFVFGMPTTMENMYNLHDYVSTQLIHNKTYAHRLPPTYIEQARGFADWRESAIFGDSQMNGIGNIASRTALSSVLRALQRIAFNDDPLQFMLIETTYHPFISFFHQTQMVKNHPELKAIPDFGSALAIELRRAPPPDAREFLRFKFRNGTDSDFQTVHVFNHHEDIPLTEFIYRLENSVINSNSEWVRACRTSSATSWLGLPESASDVTNGNYMDIVLSMGLFFLVMLLCWSGSQAFKRYRRRNYIRLGNEEVGMPTAQVVNYGTEKPRLTLSS